ASNDQTMRIWKQKIDSIVPPPERHDSIIQTPPPVVIQPPSPKPQMSEVQMQSQNIPLRLRSREVKKTKNFTVKKETVDLFVFDDEIVDGDTLSLFFNGEWVLSSYGVVREKKKITLQLKPNTNNYLVLFADNLGTKPPNTAAIQFFDAKQRRTVRLSSDLS